MLAGEVINELYADGAKQKSYVRVGTSVLANLTQGYDFQTNTNYNTVHYEQTDVSGMSIRKTKTAPEPLQAVSTTTLPYYIDPANGELDAGNTNVGIVTNYNPGSGQPPEQPAPLESESPMFIDGQRVTASLDGMAINAQMVNNLINSGWIGGQLGLTRILMTQSDARFTNVRVRLSDSNTWRNFGSDVRGAANFAFGYSGIHDMRMSLNMGFSASIFSFSFLQTGQTQTRQPEHNLNKDFKAFLKANPDCKGVLKNLGINIKNLFKGSRITDTTVDTSDLNKTLKELGYEANEGQPIMEESINATLLSAINPPTKGFTIQGTNKVYIPGSYFNETSAAIRGKTIVHELLHVFFKSGHVQLARGLGLDIQHNYQSERYAQTDGTVDDFGYPNFKTIVFPEDKNDFPASQMINAWLLNNCGRGHKKN